MQCAIVLPQFYYFSPPPSSPSLPLPLPSLSLSLSLSLPLPLNAEPQLALLVMQHLMHTMYKLLEPKNRPCQVEHLVICYYL